VKNSHSFAVEAAALPLIYISGKYFMNICIYMQKKEKGLPFPLCYNRILSFGIAVIAIVITARTIGAICCNFDLLQGTVFTLAVVRAGAHVTANVGIHTRHDIHLLHSIVRIFADNT